MFNNAVFITSGQDLAGLVFMNMDLLWISACGMHAWR